MLSIIAKKIEADIRTGRSNYDRSNALIAYCAEPASSRQTEKCVAFASFGFSEDDPTLSRIMDEFRFDMQKARLQKIELLSHWVLSWKGGAPREEDAIAAGRELMLDLGYPDYGKMTIALHNDTDHFHAHIVACKVDAWSGKMIREGQGWYKRESQRALARMADRHGWTLEAGARFRVQPDARLEIVEAHRQGRMVQETRKIVTETSEPEKSHPIPDKALAGEKHRGVEALARKAERPKFPKDELDFLRRIEPGVVADLLGVELKPVAKNGRAIKNAFDVLLGNDFTYADATDFLVERFAASLEEYRLWRDHDAAGPEPVPALSQRKDDLAFLAQEAAEETSSVTSIDDDALKPAPQARREPAFTKAQLDLLRKIPPEKVWEILGQEPRPLGKNGRKISNAFDVVMDRGASYADAADFLNKHFPEQLGLVAPKNVDDLSANASRVEVNHPTSIDVSLKDALAAFAARHEGDFSSWDFASFHRHLAKVGLECARFEYSPHKYGVAYSLDGKVFEMAQDVFPGLDYDQLRVKLKGQTWRKARDNARSILAEVRGMRVDEPITSAPGEFVRWPKEELDRLREVPPELVWRALDLEPRERNGRGKLIKSSFDVLLGQGFHFSEAADFLAQRFPLPKGAPAPVLPIDEMLAKVRVQGIEIRPGQIKQAKAIAEFMGGLGAHKMDVWSVLPKEAYDRARAQGERVSPFKGDNMDFAQICKWLPVLARHGMLGVPGKEPVGIYCRPVYGDHNFGVFLDDANANFIRQFPPTLILRTSDTEKGRHAFYVMPDNGDNEHFRDWFMDHINRSWGDPSVKDMKHPTRLPGFQNQKRLNPTWVHVEERNGGVPKELIDYMAYAKEHLYPIFLEKEAERISREGYKTVSGLPAPESGRYGRPDLVPVPEKVLREGLAEQRRIRARYGEETDRSRVDWEVAGYLYRHGANPDEVYSFLVQNLLQAQGASRSGSTTQISGKRQIHWQAERIALKQAPISFIGEGSAWRAEKIARGQVTLDPADRLKETRKALAETERSRQTVKPEAPEAQNAPITKHHQ